MRVDRDAVAVGRNSDRLEAEAFDARPTAGGDEQAVTVQLATVVEREDVLLAVATRGGRSHAERELDAVATQHLAERLAQRLGLAGQHVAGAPDERHLTAQTAHRLGHLDADGPGAEHEQPCAARPSCRSLPGSSRCRRALAGREPAG